VSDEQPLLRVVRGEPTTEELAALVAVVTARAAAAPPATTPGSAWTDRTRLVRRCPTPGPSAWRASGWPA
jgi:Acyl-CoA carboxylase epsilon subunit